MGTGKSRIPDALHIAFHSGRHPDQMQWYNDLQRKTTSPENAVRIRRANDDIDVTDLLARVRADPRPPLPR